MKLGPRVAITTTLLMAGALAFSAWAVLHSRRADLEADLERQAVAVAEALTAGLEPMKPAEALKAAEARVAWVTARGGTFSLETLVAGTARAESYSAWGGLVDAATAAGAPVGRLFTTEGRGPVYAMAIPVHNAAPDDPNRQAVAVLGLKRDGSYIDDEVAATARRLVPYFIAAVVFLGLIVYLLALSSVASPLRRLVDALDAVSKGDLSRALLPQREDEIGSLAARFNAMTNYLRDARQEEARANTARLSLETRLRHSEKLATMGQMAAEIAHEVGTPLNVIGGRARSMARRPNDPAEVQKNSEIIGGQVDRITKVIRRVLDFSRKSRPTLSQVDVGTVAAEALGFVDEAIRRQRIDVKVRTAPDLPRIPGDPDEIQQVCLNLLTNAVHAMPKGGSLSVVIESVMRRKEGLDLSPPARFLMLEVSDTGQGVPDADQEKIFEAFFTTKDTGEGTGLGLAVSKGIIKDHDGWIEVDNRPGGGAVFRVFLPLSGDGPIPEERDGGGVGETPPLPNAAGSARIE